MLPELSLSSHRVLELHTKFFILVVELFAISTIFVRRPKLSNVNSERLFDPG